MNKFDMLYISNNQWKELQSSEKNISPGRKLLSMDRIKTALRAIKLSQSRLVEVSRFNALLKKHRLNKNRYGRDMITKVLNEGDKLSDNTYIEWIKIFIAFFYADCCIFIPPEEVEEDLEDFIIWFEDYCRNWENRKKKMQEIALLTGDFNKQKARINAIIGRWEGIAYQKLMDNEKLPLNIKGELKIEDNNLIRGELRYTTEIKEKKFSDVIILYGKFHPDSFLRLNYENRDYFITQFGTAILRLDTKGVKLEGKIIGVGYVFNEIIQLDICLKKIKA